MTTHPYPSPDARTQPGVPDRAAPAAVVAHNVAKSFRTGRQLTEILHGVSLSVNYGEMVAVMGPSGSGKSTLLYCLAGLESVTSGEVQLNGRSIASCSRAELATMRRSEIGFVFQAYNLIPTLTAVENVSLPYLLDRRPPPMDVIEQTLATVGLGERLQARPPSMSGGEQQRVALARVLAQRPRIVFADEPTGALDTRSGVLVLDELHRISEHPEQCVLVVTHDPTVAARCDRVLFMRDGLLVRELRPTGVDEVAATLAGLSQQTEG
ncbi:MAG: ABC transporter ATP-binding protein [Micropruina sp.]|uniref:ABC transporter ATP-binding protein n=1 Tax=Micropruina sp. TaxID=2737536 RepID=UPI0039E25B9E